MFCTYFLHFSFLSSEDFPASGVLLQRSDEAPEEKGVLDTRLAGGFLVARRDALVLEIKGKERHIIFRSFGPYWKGEMTPPPPSGHRLFS